MSEKELREKYMAIQESWKLIKKYSKVSDEAAYWTELVREAETLQKELDNDFATDLIIAALRELERIGRNKNDRD